MVLVAGRLRGCGRRPAGQGLGPLERLDLMEDGAGVLPHPEVRGVDVVYPGVGGEPELLT